MPKAELPQPADGIEIKSTVFFGPLPVPNADDDLAPLVGRVVAVISSAATNLFQHAAGATDERGSARRLCALAALGACGELRALLLLSMSGLAMQGRIHLRTLDDCLKRIVVYFNDQGFALETERALPHFQADGFSKLDNTGRELLAARDDETARRFDEMMQKAEPPPLITKHRAYKGAIGSLDPFRRWAYSQVEHSTPIALAEISGRLSRYSENIYNTDEGVQLLVTAVGMGLIITAHLASLGVDVKQEYSEMEARLVGILERSGLAGIPDTTAAET